MRRRVERVREIRKKVLLHYMGWWADQSSVRSLPSAHLCATVRDSPSAPLFHHVLASRDENGRKRYLFGNQIFL
jgi:hypothetical protein